MTLNRMKLLLLAFSLCLATASCSGVDAQSGAKPAAGAVKLDQPAVMDSGPKPGLAVIYTKISKKVRHVNSMRPDKRMLRQGEKGKPLLVLDHAFGDGPCVRFRTLLVRGHADKRHDQAGSARGLWLPGFGQ